MVPVTLPDADGLSAALKADDEPDPPHAASMQSRKIVAARKDRAAISIIGEYSIAT